MMEFQLGETIVNYFMDLPETGEKVKDDKKDDKAEEQKKFEESQEQIRSKKGQEKATGIDHPHEHAFDWSSTHPSLVKIDHDLQ